MALPAISARRAAAQSAWLRWRLSACTRGSNGASEPLAASVESTPVTSAVRNRLPASNSAASACAVENCVPLRSARPSLGPSATGASPAHASAALGGLAALGRVHLADADHGRRHVRERGEIARGADRALTRHDGDEPLRQHRLQHRHRCRLHAGGALRRGSRASSASISRTTGCDVRLADARGMREHDVALQAREIGRLDAHAGELAEAGVDAVDGLALGDDGGHRARGCLDRGRRSGIERDVRAPVDRPPIVEAHLPRPERDGAAAGSSAPPHAWHAAD